MVWKTLQRLVGSSAAVPVPHEPPPPTADARVRLKAIVFDRVRSTVPVAGESFCQPALEALGGGRTTRGVERTEHQAGLFPESGNPKDPAAVEVQIDGRRVGYLSRADARAYRPIIDRVATKGFAVGCHASLTGGWDRGAFDCGAIGVVLHLGSPGQLMTELREGGLVSDGVQQSRPRQCRPRFMSTSAT